MSAVIEASSVVAGDTWSLEYFEAKILQNASQNTSTSLILGPGLKQQESLVLAIQSGALCHSAPNKWWIEVYQKKYVPSLGDSVVGIVTGKMGESYRVDIGAPTQATLPFLSFEGATRRNRPNLKPGQLVYARICVANKDMEPELTCVNPATNKADGYGELVDGTLIKCSLFQSRCLLSQHAPVLVEMGRRFPFEIVVGLNGRVWVKADSVKHSVFLVNAITKSEWIPSDRVPALLKSLESVMDEG